MGFFSVLEVQELGFCGGLLILNQIGRPLEFHCTLPIQPTKTQEILYGESLRPLLFGDSIGKSLVDKTRLRPDVLWVDSADAAGVHIHASCPIGHVMAGPNNEPDPDQAQNALAGSDRHTMLESNPSCIRFGEETIDLVNQDSEKRGTLCSVLDQLDEEFVLTEPFSRIRQAIEEAHAVAR